ncbi:MAG: 2-dehydro-3-deoxygalactonokinase [Betaproteobacteria bacterium]|nr:2-dehydro-3-deoxygalactonokinase [Betaproteobacteria bacterium]
MYTSLLAVDWGTSSLRGALLSSDGVVIDKRTFPQGILQVAHGQFPNVFEQRFGDWMKADTLCLISGMAGSRQGWREAPYCPCPSGFEDIAQHLQWIEKDRIGIVPGLSTWHGSTPDVMRGEEIQIFGALTAQNIHHAQFVLPGTHSKWAQVDDRKISAFKTFMTGEFYALLSQHSILAKTCLPDAPLKKEVFLDGVMQSQQTGGLLHHAFSARSLALFEKLNPAQSSSYVSGLLIGEEIQAAKADLMAEGTPLLILGNGQLTLRYSMAMAALGLTAQTLAEEVTWTGLWALAHHLYPHDFI